MKQNKSQQSRAVIRTILYRACALLLLGSISSHTNAQDSMPSAPRPDRPSASIDSLSCRGWKDSRVEIPDVLLPAGFEQLQPNELTDPQGVLHPFWAKVRRWRMDTEEDTLRVVHVGDSHVRGHIFPRTCGTLLGRALNGIIYTDDGINGAICTTFTRPERLAEIVAMRPDLIILSFGTNESHNRRYNPDIHYRQMEELVRLLRARMPDVPMLMTTPPGSYDRTRLRRRRYDYTVNPRTAEAVQAIRRFASQYGLAVWDMYNILGGPTRACLNWQGAGLMRPDHVHYLPEAYHLQGELLCQALLKAYNEYMEE